MRHILKRDNMIRLCLILLAVVLASCGKKAAYEQSDPTSAGGFYNGDNLPDSVPNDVELDTNAVVKYEPLSKSGNKPYTVMGKSYRPLKSAKGYVAKGVASWYGKKFHGRPTSSGEIYDMWAMSAAHTTLPLPTYARVTNLANGKHVIVKINDRGPFLHNRIIDLSYAAALKIGMTKTGTAQVEVKALHADRVSHSNDGLSTSSNPETVSKTNTDNSLQHYVQVGAYSILENAFTMRRRLKQLGYQLFPEFDRDQKNAGLPYRVRIGPYHDLNQALKTKSNLELQFGEVMTLISY
ncbi:MAG: septal ring lytic transglycosylase RlpA family protein [Gammaproteobacteria bacterium]|nr:septal ring lytic transglycosylase RlpA family protein [Gammaproteobacteria bacterium]